MIKSPNASSFLFALISCNFVASSCIPYFTGPSDGEVQSIKPAPIQAGSVPMIVEVERTLIKEFFGRVVLEESQISSRPLQYIRIELTDKKRIFAETSTDGLGHFELRAELARGGDYWIRLKSSQFVGETKLTSQKRINKDIVIRAERTPAPLPSPQDTM